jgi:hypothetical protein
MTAKPRVARRKAHFAPDQVASRPTGRRHDLRQAGLLEQGLG